MKNILSITMALALCAGVTGCQLFNGGDREASNSLRADAELISYVSTALYLQSNPQDRGKFDMARSALDLLVADENLTSDKLNVALSQLPINELRTGNGAILFNTGLLIMERFGGGANQVLPENVRTVAIGIRDGLTRAMGPPVPQPAT